MHKSMQTLLDLSEPPSWGQITADMAGAILIPVFFLFVYCVVR